MKKFGALLQKIRVRDVIIPNRLALAPVNTSYTTSSNHVSDRLLRFHETIASGGIGLSIIGSTGVAQSGQVNPNGLMLHTDQHMIGLEKLFRTIKRQGSVAAIQLMHAGRQTHSAIAGSTPVAPSSLPCPVIQEIPHELTVGEILDIEEQFAQAAYRAVSAGAEIIEIHGAHGYLVGEFVSPYSNKRQDRYGGSLANRLRFPLEVIEKVREKVGNTVPIMYRHSADEFVESGISLADSLAIAPALVAAGVDIISVSAGIYASRLRIIPPHDYGSAVYAGLARAIKQVVEVPVAVAGNIWDLETANRIVAEGYADIVAIARALIADPLLVTKTLSGKTQQMVKCTGCGICDYGPRGEPYMTCSVNPDL